MAEVKFVNAVKYRGMRYPAHTPFTVANEDIEMLVALGAIVTVAPVINPEPVGADDDLTYMTVEDLRKFAAAHDIDISKVGKKADIIETIRSALSES